MIIFLIAAAIIAQLVVHWHAAGKDYPAHG